MFDWFSKRGAKKTAGAGAFPYPLHIVHGRDALETFERLKREGNGLPIVLGGEDAIARTVEQMQFASKDGRAVASTLRLAEQNPFPAGLRAEQAEELRRLKAKHPDWEVEEGFEIGTWPDTAPSLHVKGPAIAYDVPSGDPFDRIVIALIPTADATEIPAYLHWGGWNACPAPQHHVAAARCWRDKYGAELVTMSSDVVEYRVARRPATREEALALAREQHDYCSEIQNLSELAAELMANDWWFFWWD